MKSQQFLWATVSKAIKRSRHFRRGLYSVYLVARVVENLIMTDN
jgi:hypothetical protein